MMDYILQLSFAPDLEEVVQGHLFLTASTGIAVIQPGIIEAYFDTAAAPRKSLSRRLSQMTLFGCR